MGFSIQIYQENDPNRHRYEMEATQILKLLQPEYFVQRNLYVLSTTMSINKWGYFCVNAEFDVNLHPEEIYYCLDQILMESGWEKDIKSKYPVLKYKNEDWTVTITVKEFKRYSVWLQRNKNRLGF